jgi:hypothetical protein
MSRARSHPDIASVPLGPLKATRGALTGYVSTLFKIQAKQAGIHCMDDDTGGFGVWMAKRKQSEKNNDPARNQQPPQT